MAFKDQNGEIIPGSISEIQKLDIGGIEQYILIRGADSSKPVLLYLHGGPGSPESFLVTKYNPDLEKEFIVAYWIQRGAAKSYSRNIPAESMNIAQFVSDTKEVSEFLAKRFEREKIFLLGHSWGTLIGVKTAELYPELYYAYLGIGQLGNQYLGEKISLEWIRSEAKKANDKKDIKRLEKLELPTLSSSSSVWVDYLTAQRKYVTKYGGGPIKKERSLLPLIKTLLNYNEYTIRDKTNYLRGALFSSKALWTELINYNLNEEIDSISIPVLIFQGIYDYQTPYSVAQDFYHQLKASKKYFSTFKNSSHSPHLEEPLKFNEILKEFKQSMNEIILPEDKMKENVY